MTRYHATSEGNVQYTAEEEAQADLDLQKAIQYKQAYGYKIKRAEEYPSIPDQLDAIFHGGLDAWKIQIQAVKDKYPKP
jgi:hypothetical protein